MLSDAFVQHTAFDLVQHPLIELAGTLVALHAAPKETMGTGLRRT